ncbi:MAG: hypothetical protein RMK19_04300 [Bacteroidia bacterium]|nr:hypothetical protein [Bacteroidia bacterium]MDW8015212.1 hypothetical protein [Bacteroidia bacterium]
MDYKTSLHKLTDEYQRERRRPIGQAAMEILIQVFPAVLVAQADGFTDTSEVQRLEEILAFLCREQGVSLQELDWTAELRYLAIDADFWRAAFLSTLRAFLQEKPERYKQQVEFLYATAAASTGDVVRNLLLRLRRQDLLNQEPLHLISEKERMEIERLVQELGIDTVPEALSYLYSLLEKHG